MATSGTRFGRVTIARAEAAPAPTAPLRYQPRRPPAQSSSTPRPGCRSSASPATSGRVDWLRSASRRYQATLMSIAGPGFRGRPAVGPGLLVQREGGSRLASRAPSRNVAQTSIAAEQGHHEILSVIVSDRAGVPAAISNGQTSGITAGTCCGRFRSRHVSEGGGGALPGVRPGRGDHPDGGRANQPAFTPERRLADVTRGIGASGGEGAEPDSCEEKQGQSAITSHAPVAPVRPVHGSAAARTPGARQRNVKRKPASEGECKRPHRSREEIRPHGARIVIPPANVSAADQTDAATAMAKEEVRAILAMTSSRRVRIQGNFSSTQRCRVRQRSLTDAALCPDGLAPEPDAIRSLVGPAAEVDSAAREAVADGPPGLPVAYFSAAREAAARVA